MLKQFYKFELLESKGFNKLKDVYHLENLNLCFYSKSNNK